MALRRLTPKTRIAYRVDPMIAHGRALSRSGAMKGMSIEEESSDKFRNHVQAARLDLKFCRRNFSLYAVLVHSDQPFVDVIALVASQ